MGIKLILGHNNMDLDCIGSMVLAHRLFPDHKPVLSRLIHPTARAVFNLYQNQLSFLSVKDVKKETLERAVIVDTKSLGRVKEILDVFDSDYEIEIFDHHEAESGRDFPNAVIHHAPYGANVTLLAKELIAKNINVNGVEATLALAGLYSDTGYFKYQNVTAEDFSAASYFMKCGASVNVLSKYMNSLKEDYQIDIFHKLLSEIVYHEINGHFVIISYLVLEKQEGGLAAVIEKLSDVENPDAVFGIFYFQDSGSVLVVARSHDKAINCDSLMNYFGGGGHKSAASALIKNTETNQGKGILERLLSLLKTNLIPAISAGSVMQKNIECIKDSWNMMQASIFLEKIDHSGAPVTDDKGNLLGMITLKDIMQARRAGHMNAPVKAYMKSKLITCTPDTTFRKVEDILYKGNIGHLPVMENGQMVGFITRGDVIRIADL